MIKSPSDLAKVYMIFKMVMLSGKVLGSSVIIDHW